jgi:hypothetical protein
MVFVDNTQVPALESLKSLIRPSAGRSRKELSRLQVAEDPRD